MHVLQTIYDLVWGIPALVLILSVGIYLSIRTGFAQIRLLPQSLKLFFHRFVSREQSPQGVSSFQALCTALAATVGTGNLAGVAGAITIGGPGAVFWMWLCGILGMVIKFSEAVLSVRYRSQTTSREWVGGPMYMIRGGLPKAFLPLASLYAFFGIVAAFGVGNATQINTVISGISHTVATFGWILPPWGKLVLGLLLAAVVGTMLLGGAERIGRTAEILVPFAAGMYMLLGMAVLLFRWRAIPEALAAILLGAFQPQAVTGGLVGSVLITLRTGVSRGVFTNEAGMGTAAMAHGAASVHHPVEQGMMGIVEVFLDTIVICTMTALVILVSGVPIAYGADRGIALTTAAFSAVLGPWVSIVIALSVCLFALATVLGWGLYGLRCAQYLFGDGAWKRFVHIQIAAVVLASVLHTEFVWLLAEIVNGLMAIPNLIALGALSTELIRIYKSYFIGGNYENFYQCQSL